MENLILVLHYFIGSNGIPIKENYPIEYESRQKLISDIDSQVYNKQDRIYIRDKNFPRFFFFNYSSSINQFEVLSVDEWFEKYKIV